MKIITNARGLNWQYGFLLVLFLSGMSQGNAQERTLTGIVTADSIPLMGVSVEIEDTRRGTITNMEGEYEIKVESGETIIFSHLGYHTQKIPIQNQTELNIELEPDATSLGAVEITGGYYSLDERTKTGNVTVVGRDQLDQQVIKAPLEALQGRVAGLEIKSITGMRGQAPQIILRGQSSVRSIGYNKPLYIIDGIPINNERLQIPSSLYDASSGIDPLSTLQTSNIESIEILKDADATAIYGSRGANGVIIINTKRGEVGKTKFELQAETGVSWVGKFMDLMNTEQYIEMRREAFENDGIEPTAANAPDLLLWDQNRYTDWQKELIGHHANFQKYQASINGGSAQTSFLLSGGFEKEATVFPGDFGFQNNNLLANINHRSLDNKVRLNTSINYGYQRSNLFNAGVFVSSATRLPPNAPALFDTEGNVNWELDSFGNPTFNNYLAGIANPHVMRLQTLQWNGNLEYKILKGLYAKMNIGFSQLHQNDKELEFKKNVNPIYSATANSVTYKQSASREQILIEPQLHYNIHIGPHQFNSLIGTTLQKNNSAREYLKGESYFSESQVGNIALADIKNVVVDEDIKYRYMAIFGRIGYSYNNKYFLNLTGRRDGSSRFGQKNRFGNFGAIGAAWDFYKESFMEKGLHWLSYGKLRGSYGITGNDDIGDYQYLDTYSNLYVYPNSLSNGGLVPSKLYNPYYHWEKSTKLELALDIGFWGDRALLAINWYRERTGNQLLDISLPNITGFSNVLGNFPATVQNTGLEFALQTIPLQNSNFKWTSNVNLTLPRNKLIAFPNIENSSYASKYEIGKPLGIKKLYHYTEIDPNTGKYTFEDVNADGILNNSDRVVHTDFSRNFFGGWNNNIQYKNWNLSFLFEFIKQKGMNYFPSFGAPGAPVNMPAEVLDRWQKSAPKGLYQSYTQSYDAGFYNYADSDAIIIDASFVRVKSLSLSYRLTSQLAKSIGIHQTNLYINAQNLFTLTSYKGYDPQSSGSTELPALTSVNLGLKLTI